MRLVSNLTLAVIATFVVVGTVAITDFSTSSNIVTWNNTEWSLTANKYIPGQYQSRLSLANGYVGASLAAAGPFFEKDVNQTDPTGGAPINGWPLDDTRVSFSTISGFWDVQPNGSRTNYPWLNQYGWESFISGIPHSTAIIFAFGDDYLDATVSNTTISGFSSKISFKTGVGSWAYTWTPKNSNTSFEISYSTIFSRSRPNVIAVSASITPSSDINGTITDLLDGRSAGRTDFGSKGLDNTSTIYSSVHPFGLPNKTGYVVSGADFSSPYVDSSSRTEANGSYVSAHVSTIGQTFNITLKKGEIATFYKYVGVASNDKFSNAALAAREAQAAAKKDGWEALLSEHKNAWANILTEDSIDDFTDPITGELPDDPNIRDLQIASISSPFYLLQNLQPDGSGLNDNSISVGGLASESYGGLVFWDADYWMAPGLNLAFPGWANQISNYRVKQLPQAKANAEFNKYPNGSALYSWTSGRYGNCTGTGPCVDYQYHLNPDIAFNILQQYNVTQNSTWFDNGPKDLVYSIATAHSHLLEYNATTKTYWLHNGSDPDEYANNVNNTAFTIASTAKLLQTANLLRVADGLRKISLWDDQAAKIAFPQAPSGITREYDGMNNTVAVKQADTVLQIYPLDFTQNYNLTNKLADTDYYANRQSPDGPAMTYSIYAIAANEVSPSGCSANTYTLNGVLPYLRAPWYQFSEQEVDDFATNGGTNPAFPFLTGHGGFYQVVPFGYLGVRTDKAILSINPSLPPQIPYVKVRNFHFAGATFAASINSTHTNLTRLTTPHSLNLVDTYGNTTIPFIVDRPDSNTTYNIAINQTITVPNRLYWQLNTDEGNLLQCLPAESSDAYTPGRFPLAAVDGATSTGWQPLTNESASLTVNMTTQPFAPITRVSFDFGVRPPRSATVYLLNSTDVSAAVVKLELGPVTPSLPYNATAFALSNQEVTPYVGNTSFFYVPPEDGVWSGKYARLVVEGCWEEDGEGATVGEFVLA